MHNLFLLTDFKNHIYTFTNRCVFVCVCIYICVCACVYKSKRATHQPWADKGLLACAVPVWKRLQTEQKTRLAWSDFSGRNLVTAREGHRVNQFFQMVCRKAIYEEDKKKNKVAEKLRERGKNKQLSPSFWHQAAAWWWLLWWQGRGKQQAEKSVMSLVQLRAFRTWKDKNQNSEKCSGVQLW